MNNLKKLLCMLLAAMMIFALTACGDKASDEKDAKNKTTVEKDPEAEVNKVAADFMDSFCKLDFKSASDLMEEVDKDLPFQNLDDLKTISLNQMVEASPELEPYKDSFTGIFDLVFGAITDSMNYTIDETQIDGDSATVKISFEMIEADALSSIDFDDIDFDAESYVKELLADGTLSASSSQEDVINALMPKMIEIMSTSIEEKMKNIGTQSDELELKLKKEDGKWIILNTEDTDIFGSMGDLANIAA